MMKWLQHKMPVLMKNLRNAVLPFLIKQRFLGVAVLASLLAGVYWLVLASDRYVSEAHVIIQRTELTGGQTVDFSSLLGSNTGTRADQLLLRDHLLSVDMLKKLDAKLNLRAHYSYWRRDPLSRLMFENTSIENFHRYYLSRINVAFDDYAGILIIKAQAYDADTAHAIAVQLVQEGEHFMNQMAHDLAQAQVTFLETQVQRMNERATQARQALMDYQNRKGLISPQATAESMLTNIAVLESRRSSLQTERAALQAYLVAGHPNIVQLDQQIAAVEKQISKEQNRFAAPDGNALNRTVDEFQRLELDAVFAQDMYKTALVALEKGRIEATRTIKKLSVLQAPTEPGYPLQPRRFYNTLVFTLVALLLAGIAHLLLAIVRDHKD